MAGSNPWDFSEYDAPGENAPGVGVGPAASTVTGGPGEPGSFVGYVESPGPGGDQLTVGRPPVQWLAFSAVASLVAVALAGMLGGRPPVAVVAWVISGPLAVSLIGAFSHFDTRARAQSVYGAQAWVRPAYVGTLVLCFLAVVLSSVRIAFWLGRL